MLVFLNTGGRRVNGWRGALPPVGPKNRRRKTINKKKERREEVSIMYYLWQGFSNL